MKRWLFVAWILTCAALCISCASGSFRLGHDPQPPGIDQDVVYGLTCEGKESEARLYIVERGGADADVMERIQRAKARVKRDPTQCPCAKACVPEKP